MEGSENSPLNGKHISRTRAPPLTVAENEHEAASGPAMPPPEILSSFLDHDSCISSITQEPPSPDTPSCPPTTEAALAQGRRPPSSPPQSPPQETLIQMEDRIRSKLRGSKLGCAPISAQGETKTPSQALPEETLVQMEERFLTKVQGCSLVGPGNKNPLKETSDTDIDRKPTAGPDISDSANNSLDDSAHFEDSAQVVAVPVGIPGAHPMPGVPVYFPRPGNNESAGRGHGSRRSGDLEMALEADLVEVSETLTHTTDADVSGNYQLDHDGRRSSRPNRRLELVEGKSMPEEEQCVQLREKNKLMFLMSILLFTTAVIAITVLFALQDMDDKRNHSSSSLSLQEPLLPEALEPAVLCNRPFRDDIPIGLQNKISNEGSPMFLANAWMLKDPMLESYPKERQLQRFSMVSFHLSTGGPDSWIHKDHWLDYEVSECLWYTSHPTATTTCDEQDQLLILDLHSNNLTGPMTGLGNFYPKLRELNLGYNNLHGALPPMTSGMSDLEVFIMSQNNLEGPLAGDAGFTAFNIRIIQMDGNKFGGYINPVFQFTSELQVLNLTDNLFHGEIAREFAYTTKLTYLGLSDNLYTGTIPSELGVLSELGESHIDGNAGLHGSIPSQLGLLDALEVLDLSRTNLTGEVPSTLCNAEETAFLALFANCSLVKCCASDP